MPMNESALVSDIRRAIMREYPDAFVFKVHGNPYQESGIPDLLVCIWGLFIGMEVKHQKPGESRRAAIERTTELQRKQIRRINTAGGMAGTVLSPEEALDMIERAFIKQKRMREGAV